MKTLNQIASEVLKLRNDAYQEYQNEISQDQSGDCGDQAYQMHLKRLEIQVSTLVGESDFTLEQVEAEIAEITYDEEFGTESEGEVLLSLTGKILVVREEDMQGMAGEPCSYLVYLVDGVSVDKETFFKEINELDQEMINDWLERICDQNDNNAMAWTM